MNRRSRYLPTRLLLSAAVISVSVGACAPVVRNHGYLPDAYALARLEEGLQTKREVRRMLGSPSTVGSFDGESWYYISSTIHSYAWRAPEVKKRSVWVVKFDEGDIIASVDKYGIKDGRIINFSNRKTPTKGKELTFLEQLFGNAGRVSTESVAKPGR